MNSFEIEFNVSSFPIFINACGSGKSYVFKYMLFVFVHLIIPLIFSSILLCNGL